MSSDQPAHVVSVTKAQAQVDSGEANAIMVVYGTHLGETLVEATLVLNRVWYDNDGNVTREETLLTDDVSMATTSNKSDTYPVSVNNETGEQGETVNVCGFLTDFRTTPIGGL